jgi:hypothetical protein
VRGRRDGVRDVAIVVARHRVGHVDYDCGSFQCLEQALSGDQVDTAGAADLRHGDTAALQPGDYAGSGGAGRPDDSNSGRDVTPASSSTKADS